MPDEIRIGSPMGPVIDGKMYRVKQVLRNVTVEILEADDGTVSVGWYRQENTEVVK